MKKFMLMVLFVALTFTVFAIDQGKNYDETTIIQKDVAFENLGQEIVGTLVLPEENPEKVFPVVLLFHGFTGQRHEMNITDTEVGMLEYTAVMLAENGFASLRIDFRGSGESEGIWEDTTFDGQISDAFAAVEFVKSVPELDSEKIAALGLSQGGLVTASLAGRSDDIKVAILWSAVSNPPYTYSNIFTNTDVFTAKNSEEEIIEVTLPWGATTALKKPFFENLFMVDPVAGISNYKGYLQVVVGLNDTTVYPQPECGQIFLRYHEGPEEIYILDCDHMLDVFYDLDDLTTAIDAAVSILNKAF
ncbi:MAG: uncharacterized protein PWQ77_26 [Kosmotogales bacterium]|nr:uncharacterized protein [Kosmotogales bacterium]